jgi:hypothetical protein
VLLAAFVTGCGSSDPIVIHPRAPKVDSSQCPAHRPPFSLAGVQDKRGYADARNVGFTQTGLYNVRTSLRTDRPAAHVVRDALVATMRRCGMLADSASARPLTVDLLSLQISEQTGLVSETMTGQLRYEVIALDPDGGRPLDRFQVTGQSQHSGVDTTDFAEETLHDAIASSLPSFLLQLSRLREAPGDPSPSEEVADDAAADDAVADDAPSEEAPPVRVRVRGLTRDEENARFGTTLADKQILAVEIDVERTGSLAHELRFRRQDFRLTFRGGAQRFPLDPTKLRERNGLSMAMFAVVGFVPIYVGSVGMGAATKSVSNTLEQVALPGDARAVRGTLLFDLEGAPGRPLRIDVSYEDVLTHETQSATARYAKRR